MDEIMSNIEIVRKYGELIDNLSRSIRRQLTENNVNRSRDDIRVLCEDIFFENCANSEVNISDVYDVIMNIYRRVVDKYGILSELLEDPSVNEIMVNGPWNIYVERDRKLEKIDDAFLSESELEETIRMLASDVHREINEANPIVDARLPSGYRVNGVLQTIAINGPILTIRKFADEEINLERLVEYGSISEECCEDLKKYVRCGYNVFISGGTSSGKTTFLNALAGEIDPSERVIVIEDSAELKLAQIPNCVHMECRGANSVGKGEVSMQQLIKTSLRMRPDRIVVGEVRGREVVDMVQAMNTGHDGSMSTGHGNSIKGMLNRLETMYLMDAQIPMYSIKNQLANAIDIFVHLRRDSKSRRGVVEVAELVGFDGSDYILNYLYITDVHGELVPTGNSLIDKARLELRGH
ncbi:MAG: ATPase, T2SS/T4P/T4SS family [Firmicutes bacterium]|nr:ATPase, T2SS/T4P/T4SS family [Bacillota bacterium]